MRTSSWLLGLVLGAVAAGGAGAEAPRVNVLFLMSDDLRPELGTYGHPVVKTPHIDALAKAGVRFDRAYCQFPLCNPSRTSLLTGRYPTTTGVLENTTHFRTRHPDYITLPQHFKAHGYAALRTGKIFHGGLDDPLAWTEGGDRVAAPPLPGREPPGKAARKKAARNAGVQNIPAKTKAEVAERRRNSDRIVVLEGEGESHGDYRTTENAIALLNKYQDRPFFLACGWTKPHSPPTAPRRFFDMYSPDGVTLPVDFAPRVTVPTGFPALCLSPNGDLFIGREATPDAAREMIRAYWASLTWVDHNVGRVLAELDRLKLRETTIVVFWGDHGYHLGEKGKWAKHNSLFEVGARVPLIVSAPGRAGNGRACERPVETLDLYPTLTRLCGLPAPEGIEGESLVPLLDDPGAAWEKPAFTVTQNGRSVRDGRWRYAEWGDGGAKGAMLLDEQADPAEGINLAEKPEHAATRARLSGLLKTLDRPAGR
jgi:arylsulfatase A-like enzyme